MVMALERSPKKRHRHSLDKVLCNTEKSSLVSGEGGLDAEDVTDVWLVRVPWELDPAALNGMEVELSGTSSITVQEKLYRITATPSAAHNCTVLLPSSRPGQLVAGPPLVGQLTVHRTVPQRTDKKKEEEEGEEEEGEEEEEEENDSRKRRKKVEIPSGLRQRWKPFGWKDPPLKGESPVTAPEHKNEPTVPSPNKAKKTKAKKKKHHHRNQ